MKEKSAPNNSQRRLPALPLAGHKRRTSCNVASAWAASLGKPNLCLPLTPACSSPERGQPCPPPYDFAPIILLTVPPARQGTPPPPSRIPFLVACNLHPCPRPASRISALYFPNFCFSLRPFPARAPKRGAKRCKKVQKSAVGLCLPLLNRSSVFGASTNSLCTKLYREEKEFW